MQATRGGHLVCGSARRDETFIEGCDREIWLTARSKFRAPEVEFRLEEDAAAAFVKNGLEFRDERGDDEPLPAVEGGDG